MLADRAHDLARNVTSEAGPRAFTIGFSGIDGSGKSTQLMRLRDWLQVRSVEAVTEKLQLRAITTIFRLSERLFGDPYAYHPTIPATLREMLVASDLENHHLEVVRPHLAAGRVVLLDRCKYCYGVYADAYGADTTWVGKVYDLIPNPDLVFLLDVPSAIARERIVARQDKQLKSDETAEFLETVRHHLLTRARLLSSVVVVDADRDPDEVASGIQRTLAERAPWLFAGR